MTAAAIELDYLADLSSYVTVRHARYNYDLVARHTEIAGVNRRAYGGRQLATDSQATTSTKQNDLLKCKDCKQMLHFELFPLSSIFLHRHALWIETDKKGKKVSKLMGRDYQCSGCRHQRYMNEKALALYEAMETKHQAKQGKKAKKSKKRRK
jgi:hypothetical protein